MNGGQPVSNSGQAYVGSALAGFVASAVGLPAHAAPRTLGELERALDAYVAHAGADGALRLGEQASVASFGVLGYLVMSSATLGDVIAQLQRYERVVLRLGETTLETLGAQVKLGWRLRDHPTPPALEDLILSAWCKQGRWLLGQSLVPDAVHLRLRPRPRPPTHRPDYERWFGCPVVPDCSAAGLVFPAAWLALGVQHADAQMHRWMQERAGAEMHALSGQGHWSRQVLALLPGLMETQNATLNAVAAVWGVSERSLRRRLGEEGSSFAGLLQQQRQSLACQYLREGQMGVLDIALALGYASHSAFTLAFRQWMGMTPSEYRARQGPIGKGLVR